jgi:hypothetical protein
MSILDTRLLNASGMLLVEVVQALLVGLLLDDIHIDVGNGFIAIKDTGDLLKGGSLGLRVHKVYPDKLDSDPALDED